MKTKWSKLRKHIHQQGGRSDGLYNALPKKVLTDTPEVGPERKDAIIDYIALYRRDKNKWPTVAHLNKKFCISATMKYYKNLMVNNND